MLEKLYAELKQGERRKATMCIKCVAKHSTIRKDYSKEILKQVSKDVSIRRLFQVSDGKHE